MRLDRLTNDIDAFDRPEDARRIDITSLADDSRDVQQGSLFFCVKGETVDGHDYISQAIEKGAAAVVAEKDVNSSVPLIRVPSVREAMGPIAAEFYDHPGRRLRIAGVTGTCGKTTTTQLIAHILSSYKRKTATIGSLSGIYTSPPAIEMQKRLHDLVGEGYEALATEVSSHALDQHRYDAIHFSVGVFTNLNQDHLDYHRTMNRYFEAKALLFDPGRCEKAVINIDDEWGRKLVDRVAIPVTEFSIRDAENLVIDVTGSTFEWQGQKISLSLIGEFNVYNALAAAEASRSMNLPVDVIAKALNTAEPVRGRVEKVYRGQPFAVLVDNSHKPGALENVLNAARTIADKTNGRVISVYGCGGNRDAEKRPIMGAIAEKLSDIAILTTDNPRYEDPEEIARQALAGYTNPDNAHVELDRTKAIVRAIDLARAGDVLIIAGRGGETHQKINGQEIPFDDTIVAADALDRRRERETRTP